MTTFTNLFPSTGCIAFGQHNTINITTKETTMTSDIDITSRIWTDRFEAIKYEKRRSGKNGTVIGLELSAHFVFKRIFQEAWKHLSVSVVTANRCKLHTAKSLFKDMEGWDEYDAGIHIAFGRCLKYFVENNMLPLHCVNPHISGAKLYAVATT